MDSSSAHQLASLAALSHAALRDSVGSPTSSEAQLQQQYQQHHAAQHSGSSAGSSADASLNEANGDAAAAASAGNGIPMHPGSAGLYSSLLSHGVLLTPRTTAALAGRTGSMAPPLALSSAGDAPTKLSAALSKHQQYQQQLLQHGALVAEGANGDNDSQHSGSDPMAVQGGEATANALAASAGGVSSASAAGGLVGLLPSFALLCALGELPSVRADVQSVLRERGASNRDKLHKIEALLFSAAEKVAAEELPLQL